MSKIALSGNASGTGTLTIAAPNTSTDRTLTLPDNTGTLVSTGSTAGVTQAMLASNVAGNGPAFSYAQSVAQSLTSNVFTKITYTSQEFDTTGGMYSSSRFTPTVAGYYQILGSVAIASVQVSLVCSVYKNGGEYKRGTYGSAVSNSEVSALVYMNGSTDYVEIYGISVGTTQNTGPNAYSTYFQGAMIRSA